MKNKLLSFVRPHDVDQECSQLQQQGYRLFVVPRVDDAESFFDRVNTAFPLDPEISGNVHWDAFSDSLWGGLDAVTFQLIALVIRDATLFMLFDSSRFDMLIECISDAANEVLEKKKQEGLHDADIRIVIGVSVPFSRDDEVG